MAEIKSTDASDYRPTEHRQTSTDYRPTTDVVISEYEAMQSTEANALVNKNNQEPKEEAPLLPHQKEPFKAYSSLIGGCIFMMLPGQVYCTGVFATYI